MQENQNIEYKESWRDEYIKWICGFANAHGGTLFIGKNDNGKVVGLKDSKKLIEDIPNKLQSTMGIIADVNLHTTEFGDYIEIIVSSYPVGIAYKGIYYYRSGATLQTLTGLSLEEFLLRKRGATWDHSPLPIFKIDDVDDISVEKFRSLASKKGRIDRILLNETKEVLLEKLNLKNGDYFTNAAMLLFSNNPDKYQPGSYIKIGYFETDSKLLYHDEVHGSLLEQVDKAIDLIYTKYMRARISFEGIQRIERYFVPEEALREALLNAICHKRYQYSNPIQISVYKDKLYIANDGSLPDNWTLENLINKHASKPYNPDIAFVFYLAGFIESWGRGIDKICDTLRVDNLPPPEFTINPTDIMIKFSAPDDRIIDLNNGYDNISDKFADKFADKFTDKLSVREKQIINLLEEDPSYTTTKMAKLLSISRVSIGKHIKSLKNKQIIERIGSDRKGYWKIKK